VNLAAVNDIPTLSPALFNSPGTAEDTPINFTFGQLVSATGATDIDGSVVGFFVTSVVGGSLEIDVGAGFVAYAGQTMGGTHTLRWTPGNNINGTDVDAFNIRAVDNGTPGSANSTPVLIEVAVSAVN